MPKKVAQTHFWDLSSWFPEFSCIFPGIFENSENFLFFFRLLKVPIEKSFRDCFYWENAKFSPGFDSWVIDFGRNHFFTQQLAQESIRGENLEFFQLKPPLKLFSMGTFSGPKKYRKFSKISKIPKKKRQKIPGMGEESSKNGFGPFF